MADNKDQQMESVAVDAAPAPQEKGNGINPDWVPIPRPGDLDAQVTDKYKASTANISELQVGPRNSLTMQVQPFHGPCALLGTKEYDVQANGAAFVMKGSMPARQKAYTVELKDPQTNKVVQLKLERGFCNNKWTLEDTDGQLVASSREPTLGEKIRNMIIGPFLGYTVLSGNDAKDRERYVIRVCGILGACCPHGCSLKSCFACANRCCDLKLPGCELLLPACVCHPLKLQCKKCEIDGKCGCDMPQCKADCQDGCIAQCDCMPPCIGHMCKAQCIECKINGKCGCNMEKCKPDCKEGCFLQCESCAAKCPAPCKVPCKDCTAKCVRECKFECGKCVQDCKLECSKECDLCKARCTAGCDLCKAKCLECVELCKKCGPECAWGCCCACNCFTMDFKESLYVYRPWDLECKHWVTRFDWQGKLNVLGQVMPGYTVTVQFPADADLADRASLVALMFYADEHIFSKSPQWCPSKMPKKESAA